MKQSRSRFGYSEECSCAVRHQKSKAIKIQKAVFVHSFELYVVMRCPILLHKSPHLKIHQRHPTNKTKQNQNKPTSVKQREARTVDEQNDDDEQVQVKIMQIVECAYLGQIQSPDFHPGGIVASDPY